MDALEDGGVGGGFGQHGVEPEAEACAGVGADGPGFVALGGGKRRISGDGGVGGGLLFCGCVVRFGMVGCCCIVLVAFGSKG